MGDSGLSAQGSAVVPSRRTDRFAPPRNVVVSVFPDAPDAGWMLYFTGIKRAPVIRKFRHDGVSIDELAGEALALLLSVADHYDTTVGVRVPGIVRGSKSLRSMIEAHPMLEVRDKPVPGEDTNLFGYLFSTAPRGQHLRPRAAAPEFPKQRTPPPPVPMCTGAPEAVTSSTIIVATDASHRRAQEWGNDNEAGAGTGWVIGHLNAGGALTVLPGSRTYDPQVFPGTSSTALEVLAVADALTVVRDSAEVRCGVACIVLYSDCISAVRSMRTGVAHRGMSKPVAEALAVRNELVRGGIAVEFIWTRGHAVNPWNLAAHRMAALGRDGLEPAAGYAAEVRAAVLSNG